MARLVIRFTLMEWRVEPDQLRDTKPLDFTPLLKSSFSAIREKALFAVTFNRESLD